MAPKGERLDGTGSKSFRQAMALQESPLELTSEAYLLYCISACRSDTVRTVSWRARKILARGVEKWQYVLSSWHLALQPESTWISLKYGLL